MDFNIVPCQFDGETLQTVNARELHEKLGVGRDFSTWIKGRIEQYGFAESADYVVFTNSGENRLGGRPAIEYHLSIDMAKEKQIVFKSKPAIARVFSCRNSVSFCLKSELQNFQAKREWEFY